MADLYLECDACKGNRFKSNVLQIKIDGKNIYDVLNMTISEAISFFEKSRNRFIELFIQFLSKYENSTKIGIIVSRNIEQALHPKSSIKLINTKFTINNEISSNNQIYMT